MNKHNYIPPIESKPSKIQETIIAIGCIATFALWGVLLALGV